MRTDDAADAAAAYGCFLSLKIRSNPDKDSMLGVSETQPVAESDGA